MKRKTFAALTIAVLLLLGTVLVACGETNALSVQADYVLTEGETLQLSANNLAEGQSASWESSSPEVATVSDAGLLTALKKGSTFITLTAGNNSAEISVKVIECRHAFVEGKCAICGKTDSAYTAPDIYAGLTAAELDAIPCINYDEFQNAMDVSWNFGWEGDQTLEHNKTKADFGYDAAADAKIWRFGERKDNAFADNAGWGVTLRSAGANSVTYMYNKISVPATANEFRIWAVGNSSEHWSGQGAFRVAALYKNASGQYEKHILLPLTTSFTATEGTESKTVLTMDGFVRFTDAQGFTIPDITDNCMLIYDMTALKGVENVVIVIENLGIGNVLGTAETEAASGVKEGDVMPEVVVIKRVMFL